MNTDQNNYQQIDDQPKSPTPRIQEMNVKDLNSKDDANQLTADQRRERKSSLIVIAFVALLTGTTYAIIIPTGWNYINTFVSEQYADLALGLLLSLFALSGTIAGIVLGYFYDIGVSLKRLILVGSGFEIIGNFFYFIGINIYVVLTSRFIAGVGLGLLPLLLAEASRRSTPETRTQLLTRILGCRQIGLTLAPFFTILLEPLNFTIFGLHVTVDNASGLLMAILWLIAGIVTICFFHDLPLVPKPVSDILNAYSSKETCTRICHICKKPVLSVLLLATFIVFFNQTVLETLLTPFATSRFNWSSLQVSILCVVAGIEILLVFVLLHFISKKIPDQTILLSSYIILSITCLIGTIFLPLSVPNSEKYLSVFLLFVILDCFALPLIVVTVTSLFSQEIKDEQQGIGQGIQRAVVNIAAICGPLYAGTLLDRTLVIFLSLFIIAVTATVLIGIVYRPFRMKTTDESSALIPPVNKDNS